MTHHQTLKICNWICKKALMSPMMMEKGKMNNHFVRMKMMSFRMVMRLRVFILRMRRLMIMNSLKLKNHIQVQRKKKLICKSILALNQLILRKRLNSQKSLRMYKLKIKKVLDHKKYKHILELNFMEIECILLDVQAFKKCQLNYLELSQLNRNIIQNKN